MTVAELMHRMSAREFSEWMAYYRIEPFGEEVADLRHAIGTAAQVNATIAAAGGKQQMKPDAYRVMPKEDDRPDSPEALRDKFMSHPILGQRAPS